MLPFICTYRILQLWKNALYKYIFVKGKRGEKENTGRKRSETKSIIIHYSRSRHLYCTRRLFVAEHPMTHVACTWCTSVTVVLSVHIFVSLSCERQYACTVVQCTYVSFLMTSSSFYHYKSQIVPRLIL